MADDRWRRMKELMGAALERPPSLREAFLHAACGGDESLRREVESLIAVGGAVGDFLSQPAGLAGEASESSAVAGEKAPTPRLAIGTRLGPYEVVSLLGAGGIGEVYKARDTRLDRTVAVKVLPAGFAGDEDRGRRLLRARGPHDLPAQPPAHLFTRIPPPRLSAARLRAWSARMRRIRRGATAKNWLRFCQAGFCAWRRR
jgi:hypothetical protein